MCAVSVRMENLIAARNLAWNWARRCLDNKVSRLAFLDSKESLEVNSR